MITSEVRHPNSVANAKIILKYLANNIHYYVIHELPSK
jgi:hypothetical protein